MANTYLVHVYKDRLTNLQEEVFLATSANDAEIQFLAHKTQEELFEVEYIEIWEHAKTVQIGVDSRGKST